MQNAPNLPKPTDLAMTNSSCSTRYNVMLFFTLFGLTAMFVALTISYVYSRIQMNIPPVRLPLIFLFNTVILLASSWTMLAAKKAYLKDETTVYQQKLLQTIFLSLVFMVAQGLGWYWLFKVNLQLTTSTTVSYLYVISILHFLHVVVGLPFLIHFYWTAKKKMVEPVSVLIYFSDPEKRLKLRLLTIYWHFFGYFMDLSGPFLFGQLVDWLKN